MTSHRYLTIVKKSKYEYDKERLYLNDAGILERYDKEGVDTQAILRSHHHQQSVHRWFTEVFGHTDSLSLGHIQAVLKTPGLEVKTDYKAAIVIGGDNSFTCASHLMTIPMIGVNSDPDRSTGHLCNWKINSLQDVIALHEMLEKNRYKEKEWTRLQATINNRPMAPATSEYFLGERRRTQMSRHILEYQGKTYEQKCSGLLIATGVGMTGWIRSSESAMQCAAVKREDRQAAFLATETYSGEYTSGILKENEELIIHSLNDDQGIVSCDSWLEESFKRGSTAKIQIGKPLKVIVPNEV
jgi:NAD kinase